MALPLDVDRYQRWEREGRGVELEPVDLQPYQREWLRRFERDKDGYRAKRLVLMQPRRPDYQHQLYRATLDALIGGSDPESLRKEGRL